VEIEVGEKLLMLVGKFALGGEEVARDRIGGIRKWGGLDWNEARARLWAG